MNFGQGQNKKNLRRGTFCDILRNNWFSIVLILNTHNKLKRTWVVYHSNCNLNIWFKNEKNINISHFCTTTCMHLDILSKLDINPSRKT